MSFAQNGTPICFECGKFCRPADEATPFGCDNPEQPEPLDPEFCCESCLPKWRERWEIAFARGRRTSGDWCKSKAERDAAAAHGLVWVSALKHGDEWITHRYLDANDSRLRVAEPDGRTDA